MSEPRADIPIVILEIALACIESVISMRGGHSALSKIARDLEDLVEEEKSQLGAKA